MTKPRDKNDESEPSCCEKIASLAFRKKVLLGFGIAAALTLIITLPIVLTGDQTSVMPDGNMTTVPGSTGLFTTTIAATSTTAVTTSTTSTSTTTTTTTPPIPTPPPYVGWGEWLEWSSCTVTCGKGQRSRLRLCSDGNGGFGDENDCPGDGLIAEECNNDNCLTGDKMVTGGYSRTGARPT